MKASKISHLMLGVSLGLAITHAAVAGPHHRHGGYSQGDYAGVVDVRPVYHRVAQQVPVQSCHYETVTYREPRNNSHTGTIVGGIVGAALGNELGHSKRNKQVGAVAGGLLGASIGRDLTRNDGSSLRHRDEQVCHTRYRTEHAEHLIGYDVTYKYRGRLYNTRTNHHPGDRIPVDVHVQPARYR